MRPNLSHDLFEVREFGRGSNRIVFLHGLFASSGIWVDSFNLFQRSRFVLVDIDYSRMVSAGAFEHLMQELPEAVGAAELVVSHSFGSVVHCLAGLSGGLNVWIGSSFLASRFREDAYVDFIQKKVGDDGVAAASKVVDFAIRQSRRAAAVGVVDGEVLFPERDEFFSYPRLGRVGTFFDGAHGDVSLGLSALRNSSHGRPIAAFFG